MPRRHAEIEQRAADPDDPQFVENFSGLAKICLNERDASAVFRQFFAGEFDRVRILIEGENIGPGAQNLSGMSAAAAGAIDDERSGPRRQRFHRFAHEHRTMISEVLHFLGRLLDLERSRREPDRSLEQQCVNHFSKDLP